MDALASLFGVMQCTVVESELNTINKSIALWCYKWTGWYPGGVRYRAPYGVQNMDLQTTHRVEEFIFALELHENVHTPNTAISACFNLDSLKPRLLDTNTFSKYQKAFV